jgi:hypothetical protein
MRLRSRLHSTGVPLYMSFITETALLSHARCVRAHAHCVYYWYASPTKFEPICSSAAVAAALAVVAIAEVVVGGRKHKQGSKTRLGGKTREQEEEPGDLRQIPSIYCKR